MAADDVSGVLYQRVKISWGVDGSAVDASASDPFPVTVSSMPAASNTTDSIAVAQQTGAIALANTILTPLFHAITASSSGAQTIISAVTSKKIRVLAFTLTFAGAVNAKWQSHVSPTDLTGLYYGGTNTVVSAGFSPTGHFETISGEALDINLSTSTAVGGSLVYVTV